MLLSVPSNIEFFHEKKAQKNPGIFYERGHIIFTCFCIYGMISLSKHFGRIMTVREDSNTTWD